MSGGAGRVLTGWVLSACAIPAVGTATAVGWWLGDVPGSLAGFLVAVSLLIAAAAWVVSGSPRR